jgi:hypothetical protein
VSNAPLRSDYPAELEVLLQRGMAGDRSVVPQLQQAFVRYPELASHLGNLADQAEQKLVALATGSCLTAAQAILHQHRQVLHALQATANNELERLLARRVAMDWLALQITELSLLGELQQPADSPASRAAHKRLAGMHARFLASTRSLALVQKLLRRINGTLSPIDLLRPFHDQAIPQTASQRGVRPGLESVSN